MNGFKTTAGKPVKNLDLIDIIMEGMKERDVELIKVKAHAGFIFNELADNLAKAAIGVEELRVECKMD